MHFGPTPGISTSSQYWRTIEAGRPRLLIDAAVVTGSVQVWGVGGGRDGAMAVEGEAPTESIRCVDGAGRDIRADVDYYW